MGFKKAQRQQRKLRLAIASPSGGGKTYSALRIAKGIIEAEGGKIAFIDTENNSASLYSHIVEFDVCNIDPPYMIPDFSKAIDEAREAEYNVLIIDSSTHAWQQVLDVVDKLTKTSASKNSYFNWRQGTTIMERWMQKVLFYPGHVIFCMRSKTEYEIATIDGKKVPEKIGLAPIMRAGIEYEFDMMLDGNTDHYFKVTKSRFDRFSDMVIDKPNNKFGRELIEWLNDAPKVDVSKEATPPVKVPEKVEVPKAENKTRKPAGFKAESETPEALPDNKKYGIESEPIDLTKVETKKGTMDLSAAAVYDPSRIKPEFKNLCEQINAGWQKLAYHDVKISNSVKKHLGCSTLADDSITMKTLYAYYLHLRQEYADGLGK